MHKIEIADNMLKSNQFSYGILGGVQQVNHGWTKTPQSHSTWVLGVFDLRNAHTVCSSALI
jgi:hypothetical protein